MELDRNSETAAVIIATRIVERPRIIRRRFAQRFRQEINFLHLT